MPKHDKKFKSCGVDVRLSPNTVIKCTEETIVGDHVAIDDWFYGSCPMTIGNYVHISAHVSVIGGKKAQLQVGHFVNVSTGVRLICGSSNFLSDGIISSPVLPPHFSSLAEDLLEPIVIDDFVTIGANATILSGVHLNEGTVIGAGAIVTKDTEPWTVYIGVPARPYKKISKARKIAEANSVRWPFK